MLRHLFFSFTRTINKALLGLNFYIFPKLNIGEPCSLKIELSSACNLKCVLCPAGENVALDRKQEFMSFDVFKKIIDQVNPKTTEKILPYLWGESLIHPQFVEMMEYIKKTNNYYKVFVSTHGNIETQKIDMRRLVKSGIYEIMVDLDGDNQESYEKYRKGGSFEKVLTFVKELHKFKKKEKSKININGLIVLSSFNEDKIDEIKKIFEEYVDYFEIKTMRMFHDYEEKKDLLEDFYAFRPRNEAYQYKPLIKRENQEDLKIVAKEKGVQNSRQVTKVKKGCLAVAVGAFVNVQGDIIACSGDPKSRYKFGNIETDDIYKTKKSKEFIDFKETVRTRPETLPQCYSCINDF